MARRRNRGPRHRRTFLAAALMAAFGALLSAPVFAQEIGDPSRGWKLAFNTCAGCHGIRTGDETGSGAPTFSHIANIKGMSAMALNVALLSSHDTMPNIVLDAQERADVIAFILTLKNK